MLIDNVEMNKSTHKHTSTQIHTTHTHTHTNINNYFGTIKKTPAKRRRIPIIS